MIVNNYHKWWYYTISIILIIATILLLLYTPFLNAHALVATSVVIAAVLASLAAFGISTVVTDMTSSQVSDYIDGKLTEWSNSKGSPITDLINGNLITMTASNLFSIGASAANGIRDFINWLTVDESITDNSTVQVINYEGNFSKVRASSAPQSVQELTKIGIPIYSYTIGNDIVREYISATQELYICSHIQKQNREYRYLAISENSLSGITYYAQNNSSHGVSQYNLVDNYNSTYQLHYAYIITPSSMNVTCLIPQYTTIGEALNTYVNDFSLGFSMDFNTGTIDIPNTVANEDNLYLDVDAPSVPDVSGLADWVMEEVEGNGLTSTYDIDIAPPIPSVGDINVDSYSPEAIASIEQAVTSGIESAMESGKSFKVNTDHHILGFTLPSFELNLSGIWYYVKNAINTASDFIQFFISMINSIPMLSIPLYMSFTLMVVLGVYRRFLH